MDQRTSGSPKPAWGTVARMSVDSSSSRPPATQSPFTVAMMDLENGWCLAARCGQRWLPEDNELGQRREARDTELSGRMLRDFGHDHGLSQVRQEGTDRSPPWKHLHPGFPV